MDKKTIEDLPSHWARQQVPTKEIADAATDLVFTWVSTYQLEPESIKHLLKVMFGHAARMAHENGKGEGREEERNTNPALKSFGEALAAVRVADRKSRTAIAVAVFDAECARGSNPYYAFAEALKTLGAE